MAVKKQVFYIVVILTAIFYTC